jgi:hypothetical protein
MKNCKLAPRAVGIVIPILLAGCGSASREKVPAPGRAKAPAAKRTGGAAAPAPAPAPKNKFGALFEARGVRVTGVPRPGEGDDVRAFNQFPGTSVWVGVRLPRGGIIGMDREASKLTVFKDDRGLDLLKAPKASKFGSSGFEFFPKIGKQKKVLLFGVNVPAVPSRGATHLTVQGIAAIRSATRTLTHTCGSFKLEKGAALQAGPFKFTVSKTGTPQWGKDKFAFQFSLKAEQDLSSIKDVRFLDAAGKPLSTKGAGSMRNSFGGKVIEERNYMLKEKTPAAKVRIDQWADQKILKVPFQVTTSVGL